MALFRAPIASTAYQHFKLPLLVSSVSSTTPRRSFNRKNYLRQKLLRTLTVPYPNSLISKSPNTNHIIQIEFPNEKSNSGGGVKLDEVEFQGTGELAMEESVGILDTNAGNVPEVPIFKLVLWLVGAFVFQTVFAVGMMLSSADFDDENASVLSDENKGGRLKIGLKEKSVSKLGFFQNRDKDMANGHDEYSDGMGMQEKIEEIRMMAREVRERERMEIKNGVGVESEDNDDEEGEEEDDFGKSGIEKEVKDRLIKMRSRLENGRGKFSKAADDTVKKKVDRRHRVETNGLNNEDGLIDKSKGFMNLNKHSEIAEVMKDSDSENHMDEGISGSGVDSLNYAPKLDLEGVNFVDLTMLLTEDNRESKQAQGPVNSSKMSGKKLKQRRGRGTLGKKAGFGKSESKGLTQDMEKGRPENEASKSGESIVYQMSADTNVNNDLKGNDYLQMDQLYSEAELIKAGNRTGLWWLSLQYVLVIFMHRDLDDDEGQRGLFTLRSSFESNDTVSYTVAFESHGDANNFCYILQTFFEDLEDFSAEVVPITIKELVGVVKSDYSRVIVVKKGQLKLYAGQPLPDVEMALRSLVGQT